MVDPVGARVLPDSVASSLQATSDVSLCQLLAFVFVIGSERVSVATRQVANNASGAAPSQPPHMDAEPDQDWLET